MVSGEESNHLVYYRKRLRLTQFQVARLLGWKNTKGLSRIESGQVIPTLVTAFRLSSIYRVPVEFLFKDRYEVLRSEIRAREQRIASFAQQTLPISFADASSVPALTR